MKAAPSYVTRALAYDLSRPFGPLGIQEECRVSPHAISFHNGTCGYLYGVQVKPLETKADTAALHAVTFRITGLLQDYGLNAASILMYPEDTDLSAKILFEHKSQSFAPFTNTTVTLAFNDSDGTTSLLVCSGKLPGDNSKCKEEELPQWYHATVDEDNAWCKLTDGIWAFDFIVPAIANVSCGIPLPRVGLRLSGIGTRAEIVECPADIKRILLDKYPLKVNYFYGPFN